MLFEYMKTPLNKYTFSNKRIRSWVEQNCRGKVLNLFAGKTPLNVQETRNDENENMPADYHMDALKFITTWTGPAFDTVILDPPYCYDEETEILTDLGWKYFKNLNKTEKVATLNIKTGYLEYTKPTDYIKSFYIGEMIKIKTGSIDLLVTPDHNLYVRKLWTSNKFKTILAKDLSYGCNFKTGMKWKGKSAKYFKLPGIKFNRHDRYNNKEATEKLIPMDDWLRFLGIWLSEGCADPTGTDYRVRIAQIKPENRIIIQNWLDNLGFNYLIDKNGFTIYNKQLCCYLRQFGKVKEKYIPYEIKQLSKKQLHILLDALILGDGHRSNKKRYNEKYKKYYMDSHLSYCSVSKKLIDDVNEISLKCGFVCSLFKINHKNIQYVLHIGHYRLNPILRKKIFDSCVSRVPYVGNIYCVNVPNHIIYVRRNKDSCWCGNSYRKSMEMYEGKITSPFNALKDKLLSILNPQAGVITFGYHSVSMGEKRGFKQEKLLLMYHGGAIHDTIAIVERKYQ